MPRHVIRIGDEHLIIKWIKDVTTIHPLHTIPGLVPDHQSPHHILNVLDDDCLHAIFVQLTEISLYEVTCVNQRFHDVAMRIKPKHIEITDDNCMPLHKLGRFFRIFGASIETAKITTKNGSDIVMVFLSDYCTNLKELTGRTYFKNALTEMVAVFPRLRRLNLVHRGSADILLQPNPHIESISVGSINELSNLEYPALREFKAEIKERDILPILEFFERHQQIEKLVIASPMWYALHILPNLQNLQELHVTHLHLHEDSIDALCQLGHLHTLRITRHIGDVTPMLRAFVDNGIELKHLAVTGNSYRTIDYDVGYLIEMKSLEFLEVDGIGDDELDRLVCNCVNLKSITVHSANITPRGILDALRLVDRLEKATFRIILRRAQNTVITEQRNEIDAIVELRKSQPIDLQVHFEFHIADVHHLTVRILLLFGYE